MVKKTKGMFILSWVVMFILIAFFNQSCTQLPKPPDEIIIDYSTTYNGAFYQNIRISPNTKIIPKSTLDRAISITSSSITFQDNDTFLNSLKVGDIIVFGRYAGSRFILPAGLLRKVVNKQSSGRNIIIETTFAALDEVFVQGTIDLDIDSSELIQLSSQEEKGIIAKRNITSLVQDFYKASELLRDLIDLYESLETIFEGTEIIGSFSLNNPNIRFVIDFSNKSLSLNFQQSGEITLGRKLQVNFPSNEINRELLKVLFVKAFNIHVVPVVLGIELKSNTILSMQNRGSINIPFEISVRPTFTYSYYYKLGDLMPNASVSFNLQPSGTVGPVTIVNSSTFTYKPITLAITIYPYLLPCGFQVGFAPGFKVNYNLSTNSVTSAKAFLEFSGGYNSYLSDNLTGFFKDLDSSLRTKARFEKILEFPLNVRLAQSNVSGRVIDAANKIINNRIVPIEGVTVKIYKSGSEVLVKTLTTNSDGRFVTELEGPQLYIFKYEKAGYLTASQYVEVPGSVNINVEQILYIDSSYSGTGQVGGTVRDSVSYEPVDGVSVKLRQGMNVREGNIVAEQVTQNGGKYLFNNLQAGYYTAELSKTGYTREFLNIVCLSGQTVQIDGVINQVVLDDQWRIVLTWSENPRDLDSHLKGPLPDGRRFHVYYYEKSAHYNSELIAQLDRDDTDSYGPETITLFKTFAGTYNYYVHDYSNRGNANSTALQNSLAQVRVYKGTNLIAVYNVPSGQGTVWHVFKIVDGSIVPVNVILPDDTTITGIASEKTK